MKSNRSVIISAMLSTALLGGCGGNLSAKQEKEAAKTAQEAFSLRPYLQEAAVQSGATHDYAASAAYWGAIYETNPEDPKAALQFASNLRYAGGASDAVNVLSKALTAHPGDALLLAERGKAYAATGDFGSALLDIEKALAANPADWTIYSTQGVILDRLGRQGDAEAAYNKALGISPGNPKILNNLALSVALAGRRAEAEAILRRAAQHPDANMQIRQNLSLLLAMQGNLQEAGKFAREDLPSTMAENNMAYFQGLSEEMATE